MTNKKKEKRNLFLFSLLFLLLLNVFLPSLNQHHLLGKTKVEKKHTKYQPNCNTIKNGREERVQANHIRLNDLS